MIELRSAKHRYIYGTGTFAHQILDVLERHGLKVSGFIDHAPRPGSAGNLPISAPDALSQGVRASTAVILGIHNPDADVAAIVSRLRSLGYGQIVTPIDLYDEFADDLGAHYWLAPRSFTARFEREIESVTGLLADAQSRDLFGAILTFRTTGDYSLLPTPERERQYFPASLGPWKIPLRLVDCGAYDGDTLRSVRALGIPLEAVAAFEPDEANFHRLTQTVREHQITSASLWPCAVYSSTRQLRFTTGQGESSAISDMGQVVVQAVSIDEAVPDFAPTLIKMDIEGAEVEALRGAERSIAAHRPGLAICVYHAPSHLWEIPLLIDEFARKHGIAYKYHLRTYCRNSFETVFYAMPLEGIH